MINSRRNKAKGLKEVPVPLSLPARILTLMSVLVMLAIWVLIIFYYIRNPNTQSHEIIFWGGASTLITILLLISLRMPMSMFNFPFRVNQNNIGRQLYLAKNFIIVAMLELNLIMFCRMLDSLVSAHGIIDIVSFILMGLLFISCVIYFVWAWRWR